MVIAPLTFLQQCEGSLSPHQYLLVLIFLTAPFLCGWGHTSMMALICVSLITSDVEYPFTYPLAMFVSIWCFISLSRSGFFAFYLMFILLLQSCVGFPSCQQASSCIEEEVWPSFCVWKWMLNETNETIFIDDIFIPPRIFEYFRL